MTDVPWYAPGHHPYSKSARETERLWRVRKGSWILDAHVFTRAFPRSPQPERRAGDLADGQWREYDAAGRDAEGWSEGRGCSLRHLGSLGRRGVHRWRVRGPHAPDGAGPRCR